MIQEHRDQFTHGVVHSFTGPMDEMEQLVALGLYIGINGCSLKTQENLNVVKAIPRDRLMIETGKSIL
jgi:TatD DNase family protein